MGKKHLVNNKGLTLSWLTPYFIGSPEKIKMGNGKKCLFCSEVYYCFNLLILNFKFRIAVGITIYQHVFSEGSASTYH